MPRVNNTKKWLAVPAALLAVIGIVTFIFAQVDSVAKIESHDSCATSHPDIRKQIDTTQLEVRGLQKTLDSLVMEQRFFNKQYKSDIKEIKEDNDEIKELLKKLNQKEP